MESNKGISELNAFNFHDSKQPNACGYCKHDGVKNKSSHSWGFSTETITPEMYENMMLLGWRRCGDYLYKPDLAKSCCKLYTLRLDVDRFKISKTQRKVMKNFKKYLAGEQLKKPFNENMEMEIDEESITDQYEISIHQIIIDFIHSDLFKDNCKWILENKLDEKEGDIKVYLNKQPKLGNYSSNVMIVFYHFLNKNNTEFKSKFTNSSDFYTLFFELLLKYLPSHNNSLWEIDWSSKTGHLNFLAKEDIKEAVLKKRKEIEENLEKKHKKQSNKETNKRIQSEGDYQFEAFEEYVKEPFYEKEKMKHNYTIELEPSSNFTEEKFNVYKKYQIAVHKDEEKDLTPSRFKHSWGTTNFKFGKTFPFNSKKNLYPPQLGTYDLVHRIDGRIIAVGILDILPTSISAVYLYYDPEFSFLNLGVFSAIREIEYLRELKRNLSADFKYYCMGFYCQTCPKMKYKGQYFPSQILCPGTLNFVDLDKIEKELKDISKFTQLSKENKNPEVDISKEEEKMILKNLQLEYSNSQFNAVEFIRKYINKNSQELIIKNFEEMILHVGKNNIKNFNIYVE